MDPLAGGGERGLASYGLPLRRPGSGSQFGAAEKRNPLGTRPLHLTAVHMAEGDLATDGSVPLEWERLTTLEVRSRE